MMHRPCVEERSKSSEGSIWSKVSFLFRLVLFVGMLPLIFPESEALVTNLNQRHVAVGHRQRAIPTLSDLLLGGLPQRNWVSLPLRRIPGKSTTSARNVERIRKSYAHEVVSSSSSSSRQNRSSSERQRLGFFPWLLIVASACYICLKYHRWRLTLSVGFLLAHFALQEGIFLDQLSPLIVLRGILAWYMAQLTANPMITKSVSAGLIGTVGDYTAQWLEHILAVRHQARKLHASALLVRDTCATTTVLPESKCTMDPFWLWPRSITIHGRYDVRRGVSMLADGILISGPLMHLGYEVFERILPIADTAGSSDPASALAAILHVVADSLLLDSFFIASRFFATGLMEGVSLLELVIQFKSIYIPSLQASWATSLILCPIQISCFRYLPLSVRVLSVNCIDVVWDAVLSFMAHRSR